MGGDHARRWRHQVVRLGCTVGVWLHCAAGVPMHMEAVLDTAADKWVVTTPDDGAIKSGAFVALCCGAACVKDGSAAGLPV